MGTQTTSVAEIENTNCQQFQQAAFEVYKQSVTTYGRKVWIESRSIAHDRDPSANSIEITTPDVEKATIRVEMKLARLRQLKFPFRLIQQLLTLAFGIVVKLYYDVANLPTGAKGKDSMFLLLICLIFIFVGILSVNFFENKAEVLR